MSEAFFSNIRSCLGGLQTANIHFVTPNDFGFEVIRHAQSPPEGLSIGTYAGRVEVPEQAFLPAIRSTEPGSLQRAEALMHTEKAVSSLAFHASARNAPVNTDSNANMLVMYAGLRAFVASKAFINKIKETHPDLFVFVLTCDCDETSKRAEFAPLLDSGHITDLWVAEECGGYNDLDRIVEEIVRFWTTRE